MFYPKSAFHLNRGKYGAPPTFFQRNVAKRSLLIYWHWVNVPLVQRGVYKLKMGWAQATSIPVSWISAWILGLITKWFGLQRAPPAWPSHWTPPQWREFQVPIDFRWVRNGPFSLQFIQILEFQMPPSRKTFGKFTAVGILPTWFCRHQGFTHQDQICHQYAPNPHLPVFPSE